MTAVTRATMAATGRAAGPVAGVRVDHRRTRRADRLVRRTRCDRCGHLVAVPGPAARAGRPAGAQRDPARPVHRGSRAAHAPCRTTRRRPSPRRSRRRRPTWCCASRCSTPGGSRSPRAGGRVDEHPDLLRDPVHGARRRAGPGAELVDAVPRDLHLGGVHRRRRRDHAARRPARGAAARADRDLGRHHGRQDRAPGAPLGRPGGVGRAGGRLPVARALPRPSWPPGLAVAADRDGRGRRAAARHLPALRRRRGQRAVHRLRGRHLPAGLPADPVPAGRGG